MGNGLSIRKLLDQPQKRDKGVPYGEQRILISGEGPEWGGGWARGWGGARAGRGECLTFGARWHLIVGLSYFAQREGEHASDRRHSHRIGST